MNETEATCDRCNGTGVIVGEPRGHDADGTPLFVQWACDCRYQPSPLRQTFAEWTLQATLDAIFAATRR